MLIYLICQIKIFFEIYIMCIFAHRYDCANVLYLKKNYIFNKD